MRIVFLLLAFTSIGSLATAQDTVMRIKHLSFATGIHQTVEENLVGLRHQGVLWKFGFGKKRIGKHKQAYNVHFGFSRPKNNVEDNTNSIYSQLAARYRYEFSLKRLNRVHVFAGPFVALEYNISMYANWDDSHVYHGNHASIGASATAVYRFNQAGDDRLIDRAVIATVELPAAAILSRPELTRLYKIDDVSFNGIVSSLHKNLAGGSWNKVRYVNASLEYKSKLTPRRRYSIGYNFSVARMKHPDSNALRMLQHGVSFKRFFR